MNAGCYGTYTADRLASARAVTRQGEIRDVPARQLGLAYRSSRLPADTVIVQATFDAPEGDAAALVARMEEQVARRDATQPVRERSAGSTFRNPAGFSSTGREDDVHDLKAWTLIDRAGLRGATLGGAQMSSKHPNFLVNAGGATAADLEALGEMVRERVARETGITLEWEVARVGEPTP